MKLPATTLVLALVLTSCGEGDRAGRAQVNAAASDSYEGISSIGGDEVFRGDPPVAQLPVSGTNDGHIAVGSNLGNDLDGTNAQSAINEVTVNTDAPTNSGSAKVKSLSADPQSNAVTGARR